MIQSSMVGGLHLEQPYRVMLDDEDAGLVLLELTLKRNGPDTINASVSIPQELVALRFDWRKLADRAIESFGIKAKRGGTLRAAGDIRVIYWVESMHGF